MQTDIALRRIQLKLVAVYILNIVDALLTYLGIAKGFITEENPLLVDIVANPAYLVLLKGIAIPAALVLLYQICRKTNAYRLLCGGTNVLLGAYVAVFLVHIYWLLQTLAL